LCVAFICKVLPGHNGCDQISLSDLSGELAGTHWAVLKDLLPAYQRITTVSVGNNRDTTF
jgi:hypothetical protein